MGGKGSTDKFGTTILTHLFCPHFGGKSSTEHHSASGFPPRSDEKTYANLADLILSVFPKSNLTFLYYIINGIFATEKSARALLISRETLRQETALYSPPLEQKSTPTRETSLYPYFHRI